jgi:hypothetical protein
MEAIDFMKPFELMRFSTGNFAWRNGKGIHTARCETALNLRSFMAASFAMRLCSRLSSLDLAYSSFSESKSDPNRSCDIFRMVVPWLEEKGEVFGS